MDREGILRSIRANVSNENLVKHMLATEAIMRALASRFGENVEEWGLTGLVHDIDVELTQDDPGSHSQLGADIAGELGASPEMCRAVLCHNEDHGVPCETLLDKALLCADPLTGLITAGALVRPDKKLEGLTAQSLMKRLGEKRFAAGVNRDQIKACSEIGLKLEDFVTLGLEAMKAISPELGL